MDSSQRKAYPSFRVETFVELQKKRDEPLAVNEHQIGIILLHMTSVS